MKIVADSAFDSAMAYLGATLDDTDGATLDVDDTDGAMLDVMTSDFTDAIEKTEAIEPSRQEQLFPPGVYTRLDDVGPGIDAQLTQGHGDRLFPPGLYAKLDDVGPGIDANTVLENGEAGGQSKGRWRRGALSGGVGFDNGEAGGQSESGGTSAMLGVINNPVTPEQRLARMAGAKWPRLRSPEAPSRRFRHSPPTADPGQCRQQ